MALIERTCPVCGKFALDEDDIEALKQPARINAGFAGRKAGELADARDQLREAVDALEAIYRYAYGASGETGDDAGHLTHVGMLAKEALAAVRGQ